MLLLWDKVKHYMEKAFTVILASTIVVWFLSSFTLSLRFCENIESSILAKIGSLFSWFFYPIIGELNWAVAVSVIQGLIAKEQVVSSLTIISGLAGGNSLGGIFASGIFRCFNKASAYAFVVFNLFSAPCLASIGAMKNELKPYLEKLIRWVIGGYGGKVQNQLQIADYILISDEKDIYIHTLEEYTSMLLKKENESHFGTPFQWTFASGRKGKDIQLKCKIIK